LSPKSEGFSELDDVLTLSSDKIVVPHIEIMRRITQYYPVQLFIFVEEEREYYLFDWNNVPGKESKRLLRILRDDLNINWAKKANICKSEDHKTISISKAGKEVKIMLRDANKGEAILKIDRDSKNLKVKKEKEIYMDLKRPSIHVYVIRDKESLGSSIPKTLKNDYRNMNINKGDILEIKGKLLSDLKKLKEKNVINEGKKLYNILIPGEINEVLQNDDIKIEKVLICCADMEIDYVWEWIHWKKEKLWGDMFHIFRISENCKFDASNFEIHGVTILKAPNCTFAAAECNNIERKIGVRPTERVFRGIEDIGNINNFDGIHVVADIMEERMTDTVNRAYSDSVSNPSREDQKFVFLNIITSDSENPCCTSNYSPKWTNLIPAKMCIYTSLSVPKDLAQKFTESFYECFVLGNDIVEATKEAREKIDLEGGKRFWKFAYVVRGNPCNKVTWA
jgi:hypothetical protein